MNKKVIIPKIRLTGYSVGVVKLDGKDLSPARSQEVRNHSPDGFSWGYSGSGPSQLALAVLLETIDNEEALRLYQTFKINVIGKLRQNQPDDGSPAFDIKIDILTWYKNVITGQGLDWTYYVEDLLATKEVKE